MLYHYRVGWMNDYWGDDKNRPDIEDGFVDSETEESARERVSNFYGGEECVLMLHVEPHVTDILPVDEVLYGVKTKRYLPGMTWQEMGRFAR